VRDLSIRLEDRPGALAEMGEALGRESVSIEGGGVFAGVAHFLFADDDAHRASDALAAAGIHVAENREVLVQKLRQAEPGQLGRIARLMADAGVNIEVQYSDHDHNLILVVDDMTRGRQVSEEWTRGAGRG
jgi:hypothetical protein